MESMRQLCHGQHCTVSCVEVSRHGLGKEFGKGCQGRQEGVGRGGGVGEPNRGQMRGGERRGRQIRRKGGGGEEEKVGGKKGT